MRFWYTAVIMLMVLVRWGSAQETADGLRQKAKAVLAQIEGEIKIPGLREPVDVLRDRWGVPHIYAKNQDDLFFAQGFVAAQDRLFQLDIWRRLAVGEMAEVLGPAALEGDRFARLVRYRGDMAAEWASYSPDTKQIATAFTRGINACIDYIGTKLPIEFNLLGFAPRKWQPEDILGRMSGIVMSQNFRNEIMRAKLIQAVGVDQARRLAPTDPERPFAPAAGLDLKGIDDRILTSYFAATQSLLFKPSKTQSNNWAVAGDRSVSGKPLLASDPHRAITVPALRYLVHLNAPGWNVIGAGEPALPGVALGHNDRIAWGITIIGTDQADIYVEDINPNNRDEYKAGERWEKMRIMHEEIQVKGGQRVQLEMRFSRHGPILFHDAKTHRAFALKWAGSEPGGAAYLGGLAVSRVQNKQQFIDALRRWKIPGLNFMYADKDDNIGWVANALTPIRKHDGLLPVPGNGNFAWQGYRDVADLPQIFNPKRGWLATANHKILYEGYKHQIGYEFAPPYRFQRIQQELEGRAKWDLKGFQALQHDAKSIPGLRLAALLRKANIQDKTLEPYVRLLTEWDGVLSRQAKAGPLYAVWLNELQDALFTAQVPKNLLPVLRSLSGVPGLLNALENPDQPWFGSKPVEQRDKLLETTLAQAVKKLHKLLPDEKEWRWGKIHTAGFRHQLAALGPAYAQVFNLPSVERTGDANTPNNTRADDKFQQIHGASYRQLFDLADWDRGLATSTPGQSGQPGSPHYGDLLPLWADAAYFPLAFSRKKVEEVTRHRLVLQP